MNGLLLYGRLAFTELVRHKLVVIPFAGASLFILALFMAAIPEPEMLQEVAVWWIGTSILPLIGALMGILAGAGLLSGEVDRGTVLLLATKPPGRWQIVMGKALGAYAFLFGTFAAWALIAAAIAVFKHGPRTALVVGIATLLAALTPALFVAVSLAASARLNAIGAVAVAGMAWLAAAGAGVVAHQPRFPFPDSLRRVAAFVDRLIPASDLSAFSSYGLPSFALGGVQAVALATIGLWLGLAVLLFNTRDLSA